MRPRTLWHDDPIFIEIGATDVELALSLRQEGYQKYLGVCGDAQRVAALQAKYPQLADQLTCSKQRKVVLNNNADVLILSGTTMLHVWKYRSVRHAKWVAWRCGLSLLSLVALVGCLCHMITGRYSLPRVVTFRTPGGKTKRVFASRVLRQKYCRRGSLHFIPHAPGLTGLFRKFDQQGVRYVVLRWFESLPDIEPDEDVDLLVADHSLGDAIRIFESLPGIQPCDVYSESGLARSAYCGTPYYPAHVARRLLDGAVRHNDLCMVPNAWDCFHSLAYHAVYHKGTRSNLSRGTAGLNDKPKSDHDFATILRVMANRLNIDVDISLEGLHAYLQETGWGPSPEMLARLAVACWRSKWLQILAQPLPAYVHEQGLTVFVLRRMAVQQGFQDQMIRMIRESGFEILATKVLSPVEMEYAAARTRGGNWTVGGPFDRSGGGPAVAVIAYDRDPLPPNRKQRRRFPQRTNARIYVKEAIRDAIIAQLPPKQSFNALHSSDHAAEAWHMIEVLAPEMLEDIRDRLQQIRDGAAIADELRRAA
jgi:hypothetical protein